MSETFIRPLVIELLSDFISLGFVHRAEGNFDIPSMGKSMSYRTHIIRRRGKKPILRIEIEEREK